MSEVIETTMFWDDLFGSVHSMRCSTSEEIKSCVCVCDMHDPGCKKHHWVYAKPVKSIAIASCDCGRKRLSGNTIYQGLKVERLAQKAYNAIMRHKHVAA